MKSVKKIFATVVFCALPVLQGSATPNSIDTSWHEKVAGHDYIPTTQYALDNCVLLNETGLANSDVMTKMGNIKSRMDLSFITKSMYQEFESTNGIVCFINFAKDFPDITSEAEYDNKKNIVFVRDDENTDFGCQVAAFIHESYHSIQNGKGYRYPIKDLKAEEQMDLVFAIEADAHAAQIVYSKVLDAQGFSGAHICNDIWSQDKRTGEHIKDALDALSQEIENDISSLYNGDAIQAVYSAVEKNATFRWVYGLRTMGLYDYMHNDNAYNQLYTLEDKGINLGELKYIHKKLFFEMSMK